MTTKKVSDYKLNPRWVCFMVSRGEDPATFQPVGPEDDVPFILDEDGTSLPRPLVFSRWVMARWKEWATGLGFVDDKKWGRRAYDALRARRRRGLR